MSKKTYILGLFMILSVCLAVSAISTDRTIEVKATGHDVVEAVIKKIKGSGIFPDDKGILKRIAYVESKFGNDKNTFRRGYFGGIWQLDAGTTGGFTEITTNRRNHEMLNTRIIPMIKDRFGIDFTLVTYEDLLKPLISGLAARMVLFIKDKPIPEYSDLEGQAKYWKDYYNSGEGKGSTQKFVNDVNEMEKKYTCRGRMDLNIVLDGSGSIGSSDFQLAKQFVADLIGTFSTDHANIAVIVYSDYPTIVFDFDSHLNQSQMKDQILSASYPGSGTSTNTAILKGIELLLKAEHRDGSPRIMAIYTDGRPDTRVTSAVRYAEENNVTIFAIGIGSNVDEGELMGMTGNDPKRMFSMASYEALSRSFNLMNAETCKVPQKPLIGQILTDGLSLHEKRYFYYPLPPEGITIKIDNKEGQTKGYYSYTDENPNSAINDGWFVEQVFIPTPIKGVYRSRRETTPEEGKVFVAVEGIETNNNYTIASEQGYHVTGSALSSKLQFSCQLFGILFAFYKLL